MPVANAASTDEIEITPAMIEAGASVLRGTVITMYAGEQYWTRETYRAMRLVELGLVVPEADPGE